MNQTALSVNDTISLTQIDKVDALALFTLINDNRNYLRRFLNWVDETRTIGDVEAFIDRSNKAVFEQSGITFTIRFQQQIIGCVSLYDWKHQLKKICIGYWISQTYSGQGIVTDCVKEILKYGFTELGIKKAELYFLEDNRSSARIAEKLGFKIEGILRNWFYLQGTLRHQVVAGLLFEEWRP